MRNSFNYSTAEYDDPARIDWFNSPFEFGSDFEFAEVGSAGTAPTPASSGGAKQIYAAQTKVRKLTDANFWNVFLDRDKVIVVAFWADSCRSCTDVARVMTTVADRFSKHPQSRLVKFYHLQWDRSVNPRVHQRLGFGSLPVVFFYFTSSGRQPTICAPLLQGSFGGNDRHDPDRYTRLIELILRKQTVKTSQRRGWANSRAIITRGDFADIDQMLVERSPFQNYFLQAYCANPATRFSKATAIKDQSDFNSQFQRIHGRLPSSEELGVYDKPNQKVYLRAMNIQLQAFVSQAVHEGVHMFACPVQGKTTAFYSKYGFHLNEGFTQFVTEEILNSQSLKIIDRPYASGVASIKRLMRVVGPANVADDYFQCTAKIFTHLGQAKYSILYGLFTEVDRQIFKGTSQRLLKEAIEKLDKYLDSL
jgi:hypothetical protein